LNIGVGKNYHLKISYKAGNPLDGFSHCAAKQAKAEYKLIQQMLCFCLTMKQ